MRTTCTQLKNANVDLYQAMRTMHSFSKEECKDVAKVAHELVHVTDARKIVADLMAAGVRHSNGTVHAVGRAYDMMNVADDVVDAFTN